VRPDSNADELCRVFKGEKAVFLNTNFANVLSRKQWTKARRAVRCSHGLGRTPSKARKEREEMKEEEIALNWSMKDNPRLPASNTT